MLLRNVIKFILLLKSSCSLKFLSYFICQEYKIWSSTEWSRQETAKEIWKSSWWYIKCCTCWKGKVCLEIWMEFCCFAWLSTKLRRVLRIHFWESFKDFYPVEGLISSSFFAWHQIIYQVRGSTEDHGVHQFTLSSAGTFSAVYTSVSRPFLLLWSVFAINRIN